MKKVLNFVKLNVWRKIFLAITCICIYSASVLAQGGVVISGTVNDTDGEPLPGVNVIIRGTTVGQVTDFNGKYSITVSNEEAVLLFSFIGYTTQEVVVGDRTVINVTLDESTTNIEEVVVVGFGTQKKVNLTGSVGVADAKMLADRPVQNATQALQGLVTGLNISQNNGRLEDKPSINIRGQGTIDSGSKSSPLILIDGMEGDINAINPQDIENISILKDAAASSIYGSRAAFGVILVTTKKGQTGKARFNYNNNLRWNSPILMPRMMDSYTFALYFNDANTNGGSSAFFSQDRLQRIKDFQDGKITTTVPVSTSNATRWADGYGDGNDNVDWYKALYRSQVFSHDHNMSLTGGNEKVNYYLSANYMGQDGLMKFNQDKFNRYTATAKVGAKVTDWATVNYSARFIREEYERPSALTNSLFSDLARQGWPVLPLYDPNGYLYSSPSPALGLSDGGTDSYQNDWLYQQLQLVFEPVAGWKIFGELNYRIQNNFRHWDSQMTYNHDVAGNAYVYSNSSNVHEDANRSNYFNPNVYSEYEMSLNQHNFKVMVGFQAEEYKYRNVSAQRNGIIVPSVPTINTTSGLSYAGSAISPTVEGGYNDWATVGFFGRLNYDYNGRYMIEGNLRYDGSSRFRGDQRWNWFPSVSAGWNVAREDFWEPLVDKVNMFKVRASYGELGNQNTTNQYPTYLTMTTGTANGTWLVGGIKPNTASAPTPVSTTLFWETVKTYDVGVDIGMLNNRLNITFDWFRRLTQNMVGPAPEMPATFGITVPKINNTDLKTTGIEIDINWKDRLRNGLGYNVHVLLSDYQTEVTRYPNIAGNITTSSANTTQIYREGMKLGEIWGYETIGIAKTKDEMDAHLATLTNGGQTTLGSQWDAGDIMYADLNGDKKIGPGSNTVSDPGDRKIIGNNTPRFAFGLDLSVDWKGFDLRAFFQGVMKRDYWQGSYYFWGAHSWGIWWSTGFKEHEDYFRADANHPLGQNLDSYYPRPIFSEKNQRPQTKYLQNAAYIRLKNLQLGYTLPASVTQKFGCEKLRLFVSGENLWTGTKMAKMFDPETVSGGNSDSNNVAAGNVYPLSRVLSAGLSINF